MSARLFVYGTLSPGRVNAHILADVPGIWEPATVRGHLHHEGWGAAAGYPGLVPDETAEEVPGLVFSSDELERHWPRLDQFEGAGYRRVLVTARMHDGSRLQVHVYALSTDAVRPD